MKEKPDKLDKQIMNWAKVKGEYLKALSKLPNMICHFCHIKSNNNTKEYWHRISLKGYAGTSKDTAYLCPVCYFIIKDNAQETDLWGL